MPRLKSISWYILLAGLFLLLPLFMNGREQVTFEQISTKDGLPNGTINQIFRDSHGFMWFCTDDGLCRYDGYIFKIYKPEGFNNISVQNLQYFCMVEDVYNHIWIGTSEGLYFFDPSQDRIIRYLEYSGFDLENTPVNQTILCQYFDTNNYLWLGSYTGITSIKISGPDIDLIKINEITTYTTSSVDSLKISNNSVYSFYENKHKQIWCSNNSDQLECYDHEKKRFTRYTIEIPDIIRSRYVRKMIAFDSNNDIWIATQGFGLIHWEREINRFTQYMSLQKGSEQIDISMIRSLIIDRHNRIWIGTNGNGLIVYDKKLNTVQHYRKSSDDPSKLSSNAIYSLFEDQEGIYWVGTYLMGLNKYDTHRLNFGRFESSPNSATSLNHNIVTGFCEDKNNRIWISTDGGGLNLFNRNTLTFKHYTHNPENQASISTNTTMTLFCDRENRIWIGTYNGGLNRFDPETETFFHYRHNPENAASISSNHAWSIVQDHSGHIWVATVDAGLNLMKQGTNTFIRYTDVRIDYSGPEQICSNPLTQLYIDKNNHLWIGTEYGLDRVDLNQVDFSLPTPNLQFIHYMPSDDENSLSYTRISCINEDSLDNIWIGTKGGGLNKLDLKTNTFTRYSVRDGLPHNIIKGILFDNDNNPWISTNNGLSHFNTETNRFINYTPSDGLQSSVFVKTSCFKASDGMFFFGGINGFNAFYPEEITTEISELNTVITDLKLFNQSVTAGEIINDRVLLPKAIYETNNITLFYHENDIALEFSALEYSNPEKIWYSYKLEGFDSKWQVTDAEMRIAKYTNLAPGKYTFRVKASKNDETWPDRATSLTISILPPWWMQWWFRITLAVSLISLFALVFLLRIYTLNKQKKILERMVEEKTRQLREANQTKDKFMSIIAHDLINPFTTILGFSELLQTNYETWDEKNRFATIKLIHESSTGLFQLLTNLLQWSRSERGLIDYTPSKINLNRCINEIVTLQSVTAKTKEIAICTDFHHRNCMVKSDHQLLSVIIRNLVSNSIKFTPNGGRITIVTKRKNDCIVVSVTDTGIGIQKEKLDQLFHTDIQQSTPGTNDERGTGLGLFLVKEFVMKQQGILTIESEVGKGSTFSFTIPLWDERSPKNNQ